jgi:hypothetical protein
MAIRDDIFPLVKRRDWPACHAALDRAAPGEDREERTSIVYWRAVVLQREGRDGDALTLLNSKRNEFNCKCLPDFMRAKILNRLGRPQDAIAILKTTPIDIERDRFPGLALEAAYLYCTLLAENGKAVPAQLLTLIPDDFQTMDDKSRFVGKTDLLDLIGKQPVGNASPTRRS